MGDCYITRRGGGAAFAGISVSYPEGSICTASDGVKTLTAKDTSGVFLFWITEAGTWTVSCTNGEKTDTRTVVIDRRYQVKNVELQYSMHLITDGQIQDGVVFTMENGTVTEAEGYIQVIPNGGWTQPTGHYSTQIELTEGQYHTLYIDCYNNGSTSHNVGTRLTFGGAVQGIGTSRQTYAVDISAMSGAQTLQFDCTTYYSSSGETSYRARAAIYNLWLE